MNDIHSVAGETISVEIGPVVREGASLEIVSSSADSPIVITTSAAHGLVVGNRVRVEKHLRNGGANGEWEVEANLSATTFSLRHSVGTFAGVRTGKVVPLLPVDLTLGGTKMWFTAKLSKSVLDNAGLVQKTELAGIALNSPVTTAKNKALVTIAAADTATVLASNGYYFDVELEEPGGLRSTIARGTWKITSAATRT